MPSALAFNTAASFVTNTNWQNYGGESTMRVGAYLVIVFLTGTPMSVALLVWTIWYPVRRFSDDDPARANRGRGFWTGWRSPMARRARASS